MKELSDEEFSKLQFKMKGKKEKKINRRRSSDFYMKIIGLKVGEKLFISKQEWNLSRPPHRQCGHITKRFPKVKYFCKQLKDKSGWGIKRTE